MHGLREVQGDFSDAILGDAISAGALTKLADEIRPSPLAPERRIQIYRNHFLITLAESLGVTYPVLKALVGEAFFEQSARRFAAAVPPASPVLFEYGEAFPRFLADETQTAEYAYLADVGALEWAINHAYHADDAQPIDARTLLDVAADRRSDLVVDVHPSARLVRSDYPVLDVWRAHQPGAADGAIDLSRGGVRLLVWRNGIDVVWQTLSEGGYAFVGSLRDRAPLALACAAALAVEPSFDAGSALKDLFAGATITGLSIAEPSP